MAADYISCSIAGCNKPIFNRRGWCSAHYAKWRKYGDPLFVVRKTPNGAPKAFIETALNFSGDDCLLWPFARDRTGYGRLNVGGVAVVASAYVCERVHGPRPFSDAEAAHTCGNGHIGCINPRHLLWKTRKENMRDMVAHGRSLRGTRSPHSKLTRRDVEKIRSLKGTMLQKEIAAMFGVHKETIGAIHRRDRWNWF